MNQYLNFNGVILRADKKIISADNRGFRYGDGLFETMRVSNGAIRLADYHFERLLTGSSMLTFDQPAFFTADSLSRQVLELCRKNGHTRSARVRLVVFRGEGGLYDPRNHFPNYLIQTWTLPEISPDMNENGLTVDLFPDGRKSCDSFSNLKSNNFLLYAMAALYAKKHFLNDCLVINSHERLADSTIANIFYIKDGQLFTPPLSEGCVAGVMRRFLLENAAAYGLPVAEVETGIEDLSRAEEVFLTNAIQGIRWVSGFRTKTYSNARTLALYNSLIRPF